MADDGVINYSGSNKGDIINSGIFSTVQNKQAQQNLNNRIFGNNGLSSIVLAETKMISDSLDEMKKSYDSMTKSQKTTFDKIQKDLKNAKSNIEKISDTNETSLDNFEKSAKNVYKVSLDYYNFRQKLIQSEISSLESKKRLNTEEKNHLIFLKEQYDEITASLIKSSEVSEDINNELEKAGNILKNTTDSWSKGLSETLNNASSALGNLANMFNINKLANSGLNQFISTKLDLQNQMMKDFGMTSKNQYLDFKSNLDSSLKDMGNLYNFSDLKNYMSNLSDLGITNAKMAQNYVQSSIMATKYLGVSNETQEQIFKYIKRTNDYDMLDDHNKTITSILQAQLGVSREQLDVISQSALSNVDALAGLGLSPEVQGNFIDTYTKSQAALTSLYGQDTANTIMSAVSEFANSDYTNLSNLTKKYGAGAYNAYTSFINSGNSEDLIKYLISSAGFANISGNAGVNATIQSQLGQDRNFNAAILSTNYNDFIDAMNNISESSALGSNPEDFVQNTTELTAVDKISNMLDKFINNIDWENFTSLVAASAGMWVGSNVLSLINTLSTLKLSTTLPKLISDTGNSSKVLSTLGAKGQGLLAAGGGILIGATATAAITAAISSWQNSQRTEANTSGQNDAAAALKGTSLEGNSALIGAYGLQTTAESTNSSTISSTASGISYGLSKLFGSSNRSTLNKKLTEWMYKNNVLSSSGKALAWALMLSSVGDLNSFNSATGTNMTINDLKELLAQGVITEDSVNKAASNFINAGWYPYTDNNKGRMKSFGLDTSLDGYHKAGKDYIPKDNYKALLHKGEMVLDSEAADAYRKGFGIGGYDAVPWPITSRYNSNSSIRSGYHTGTDFGAASGTPVGAAIGGTVLNKSWGKAWGNHVIVQGDNGLYYLYAHFSRKAVNGGRVNTGQILGYVGSTGNSTGPHLHFEVQKSASWSRGNEVDPGPYVTSGLLGDGSAVQISTPVNNSDSSFNMSSDNNSNNSNNAKLSSRPIISKRVLPSAALNSGGVGGADLISNSFDSGVTRIINYLDSIRSEQDIQREMLNTFSKANTVSSIN